MLDALTAAIAAHALWAGPLFGLLALGESTAVLGVIIPATPILFSGWHLARQRTDRTSLDTALGNCRRNRWLLAVLGDRTPFGYEAVPDAAVAGPPPRGGPRAAILLPLGWAIAASGALYPGPFQSMLPLVAGVAAMDQRRFHAWNIASGTTWVFVVLAPGYLTAQGVVMLGVSAAQQRWLILALIVVSVGMTVSAIAGLLLRWHRTW